MMHNRAAFAVQERKTYRLWIYNSAYHVSADNWKKFRSTETYPKYEKDMEKTNYISFIIVISHFVNGLRQTG